MNSVDKTDKEQRILEALSRHLSDSGDLKQKLNRPLLSRMCQPIVSIGFVPTSKTLQ
jgi:hypothetical protein